jgi:hypothetical protein
MSISTTITPKAIFTTAVMVAALSTTVAMQSPLFTVSQTSMFSNHLMYFWQWDVGSRVLWGDGTPIGYD